MAKAVKLFHIARTSKGYWGLFLYGRNGKPKPRPFSYHGTCAGAFHAAEYRIRRAHELNRLCGMEQR